MAFADIVAIRPKLRAGAAGGRRLVWPLLAIASVASLLWILSTALGFFAHRAMSPMRHELASDISIAAPPVIRSGSGSEIEVRVRHANGRQVKVALGNGFVAAATLTGITPLPSTSQVGPDGLELDFQTRNDSDLRVVITSRPEASGRIDYDLGVTVGSDVSASTPMSQVVLPW